MKGYVEGAQPAPAGVDPDMVILVEGEPGFATGPGRTEPYDSDVHPPDEHPPRRGRRRGSCRCARPEIPGAVPPAVPGSSEVSGVDGQEGSRQGPEPEMAETGPALREHRPRILTTAFEGGRTGCGPGRPGLRVLCKHGHPQLVIQTQCTVGQPGPPSISP